MKQTQQQPNAAEQNVGSPEELLRMTLYGLIGGASVFTAGPEIALRREQGSRYQRIFILAMAQVVALAFLAADYTVARGFENGLIGMGTLFLVLTGLIWWHSIHVFKMICHPEREAYSYDDGKKLGLWSRFPNGENWCMVRMVLEPGAVILLALLGRLTHLFSSVAALYLLLAGISLFVKAVLLFYISWEYIRDIYDGFGKAVRMVGEKRGDALEAVKAAMANAVKRIPMSLPPAAIQAVEDTLPPELQALLTKPEPEQQAGQENFDWLTPPSPLA